MKTEQIMVEGIIYTVGPWEIFFRRVIEPTKVVRYAEWLGWQNGFGELTANKYRFSTHRLVYEAIDGQAPSVIHVEPLI